MADRGEMGQFCQPREIFRLQQEKLKETRDLLADQSLKSFGHVVEAVLVRLLFFGVIQDAGEEDVLFFFCGQAGALTFFCFDFLLYFVLIGAMGGLYEEVSQGLVVAGEDFCCDVRAVFHLRVVAEVHGTFETHGDEFMSHSGVFPEVLHPYFHVEFDLGENFPDVQEFFQFQIMLQQFFESQLGQVFCHLALHVYSVNQSKLNIDATTLHSYQNTNDIQNCLMGDHGLVSVGCDGLLQLGVKLQGAIGLYCKYLIVGQMKEAVYHTVLESEKIAFTNHVNEVLKDDPDVKKRLPIDHKQIFDTVGDGVILCKLINIAPHTKVLPISPAAINLQPKSVFQQIENLNLAIQSAKAIGCTVVNIAPQFILQKREHIILGLIWQIIKIYISSKISLKHYPEIILLRKNDEAPDIMQRLGYEEILIRWINYHVRKNGGERQIKTIGSDMVDGYAYGHVLQSVAPSLPKHYYELDKDQRAVEVIETCKREGFHPPIGPDGITSGNPRLNTLLCAEIFNNRHGLVLEEAKEAIQLPPEAETDESRQIRVFKNWINSQGIEGAYVNYLIDDLKDGIILLKVIDRLRPGNVDWKKVSDKKHSRIHIIQNCNYAVDITKDKLKAVLIGVNGVDIVDGRVSLTLGVVWQLCKIYWGERVGMLDETKLLAWANDRVPQDFRVKNFKDKTLRNCMLLLHLMNTIQPNLVDFSKVPAGDSEEQQIAKTTYTISLGRKMGCQIIALWQHLNECTSRYITLFVAELEHHAHIKQ